MTRDAVPQISVIESVDDLDAALGTGTTAGAAVLIGGAEGLDPAEHDRLRSMFAALAAGLDASGTAIVDGGTDSGIMRLMGEARTAQGGTFRLIGVAPAGKIGQVTRPGTTVELAHGHPELLLVPGKAFGDETSWLFRAADRLSGGIAPTIVVNGGQLTVDEAGMRLATGGVVLAVAGTGRAADLLAGGEAHPPLIPLEPALMRSPRLRPIPADTTSTGWAQIIAASLEEARGK